MSIISMQSQVKFTAFNILKQTGGDHSLFHKKRVQFQRTHNIQAYL